MSQTSDWWEDLSAEQYERLKQLIDSRERLLGETYGQAVYNCTHDISDDTKKWVLG